MKIWAYVCTISPCYSIRYYFVTWPRWVMRASNYPSVLYLVLFWSKNQGKIWLSSTLHVALTKQVVPSLIRNHGSWWVTGNLHADDWRAFVRDEICIVSFAFIFHSYSLSPSLWFWQYVSYGLICAKHDIILKEYKTLNKNMIIVLGLIVFPTRYVFTVCYTRVSQLAIHPKRNIMFLKIDP